MFYRLAEESDIDEICSLIKDAVCNMEKHLGKGYQKVGFADWRKGRFYLMEKLL